ncbi:NSMAF_4 [Blepharisma stoltei]|uniref:Uncharacterized protein n=1 Tax=Blepharisma stoltei TaxID=1481888 RepID=A0AAU9KCA1_9CILI|nr:unnamed protein product [Blepharisma stoltei]
MHFISVFILNPYKMILTEFHGIPRPSKSFNLFYLDSNEALISTVSCKLKSTEFERESGKLHLTTRSLYFQPQVYRLPMVKFKLDTSDFKFSCNSSIVEPSSISSNSQTSKKSKSGQIPSETLSPRSMKYKRALHQSLETRPVLSINVKRFFVITRESMAPAFSQNSQEAFEFEINQNDLSRIATELEMVLRYNDEDGIIQLIYEVRYKELVGMLKNSQDFDSEDLLMHQKTSRLLPECLQLGAFILSTNSFHFYSLINAKPNEPVHVLFKNIIFIMRYKYLHKNTALSIYMYSSKFPLVLIFENEEQRENIFLYLQNKIKFKDPTCELQKVMAKWSSGILSNFEYLMFLNHLGNRCELDVAQYPVFPWVLKNYCGEKIDLNNPNNYRDLAVPIGALNKSRLERYETRLEEKGGGIEISLYPSHYSNPSIVFLYFIRKIPELLLRCQNSVYSISEKLFLSIEKSFQSSISEFGDLKELTPEFFSDDPDFLINVDELSIGDGKTIGDVELPEWSKDSWQFLTTLKEALENDIVSASLHNWIDIIFGYKQQGQAAKDSFNLYYPESYGFDWSSIKNDYKRRAKETELKEFGICPIQLFTSPHPPRIFRSNLPLNKSISSDDPEELKSKVQKLQNQIQSLISIHQKEIQAQEKQYKQLTQQLKLDQENEIKELKEELKQSENHQKSRKEEIKEIERNNKDRFNSHFETWRTEREKDMMRISKTQHAKSLEALIPEVQQSKSIKIKGFHGIIGRNETQKSLKRNSKSKEILPLTSRRSHSTQSVTPPKIRPSSSLGSYK